MFSFFNKTMSDNSKTFFDFEINSINGDSLDLSKYTGKAILLVNVASNCGFTKQYDDLQKLYDEFKNKGLIFRQNYHPVLFINKLSEQNFYITNEPILDDYNYLSQDEINFDDRFLIDNIRWFDIFFN